MFGTSFSITLKLSQSDRSVYNLRLVSVLVFSQKPVAYYLGRTIGEWQHPYSQCQGIKTVSIKILWQIGKNGYFRISHEPYFSTVK